jgi:hypothetical protein
MENISPKEQPIANCARIVDEVAEVLCDKPGHREVLVRNRFGLFAIALCVGCFADHRKFYAEQRSHPPRRVNTSSASVEGSQPRGRSNGTNNFGQPKGRLPRHG